ncbi:MAG TPA: pyridoxal-dependent decarboxylase [bacterium]|nr:pyridoxal-dependent decarboxylase [bacterium]
METEKNYHMTADDFRKQGHALIDWIARYYETVEALPVLSQNRPGDVRRQLPEHAPQTGEPFSVMMQDVERIILPGVTHWQSPNFFAFFPSNSSYPAVLGELLSAGLGVQGMLWASSPACTELETHVMDWLVDMMDLPPGFKSDSAGGGVIQESASSGALCAIVAARERATELASNRRGCNGRLTAYASTQAHSSIEKAIKLAGIGGENLRLIPTDARYAMRPDALAAAIGQDREKGLKPFFVAATVGTTSVNGMDPLPEIGRICQAEKLWLHVDGAMAGSAAVCPEFRRFFIGLDSADSYCFNPHKWLFTNFDCDCFFVRNRAALIQALTILPEYLRNQATESGAVIDYRDWQVSLGRRFRALKLWFVIRHYGVEGLQHHIRRHVRWAQTFAGWVSENEAFELTAPPPLNLVCFRLRGSDALNQTLMDRLNQSGRLYLTHTKLNDRLVLRFCVGQTHTEFHHVQQAWNLITTFAQDLQKKQ